MGNVVPPRGPALSAQLAAAGGTTTANRGRQRVLLLGSQSYWNHPRPVPPGPRRTSLGRPGPGCTRHTLRPPCLAEGMNPARHQHLVSPVWGVRPQIGTTSLFPQWPSSFEGDQAAGERQEKTRFVPGRSDSSPGQVTGHFPRQFPWPPSCNGTSSRSVFIVAA